MLPEDIKNTIIECFDDENFIARLHERLLTPIVSRHVAEAMEVSSREIQHPQKPADFRERRVRQSRAILLKLMLLFICFVVLRVINYIEAAYE